MDATELIQVPRRSDADTTSTHTSEQAPAFGRPTGRHQRLDQVLKGRYRVESLIASGGMSDVYRAVDEYLEQAGSRDCEVAVKILRSALTQDTDALSLLAREAAKSMRLSHPNIIRVNDLDQDNGTWFMVMELLDGEALSRVIQRAKPRGLSWRGTKAVLEQIVDALNYSHRRGIVHADLKPSNVFFTRDGHVKLLDFGVARALKPHQPEDFLNPRQEDETTVYGYTPAYASPSVMAGNEPGADDDLYALACISYELLSSRHPFDRRELSAEERAAFKLKRPKNMPLRLWRVVKRLLKQENPGIDLPGFRAALSPGPQRRILLPGALGAAVGLTVVGGFVGFHSGALGGTEPVTIKQRLKELDVLEQAPPRRILSVMDQLEPLERAALLKHHENHLIDYYLEQTDGALGSLGRDNLSKVPETLTRLEKALEYYPNNADLERRTERLKQQKSSLASALSEEVQARLEQGDYEGYDSLAELEGLADNLAFVRDEPLEPSGTAISVFRDRLQSALSEDDESALARLLGLAERFFDDTGELEETLTRARSQEEAIEALGAYNEAVANGDKTATFPVEAAQSFYGPRVSDWQEQISNATTNAELDAVYNRLKPLKTRIPSDFEPVDRLRKTLANAYMERAEALLNDNRASAARPMLAKARDLMGWHD